MSILLNTMTREELTAAVFDLQRAVDALRYELGEQGDGKPNRPIHPRLEALETFAKRQT